MDGVLIFAFIGGAVATVNPCGVALLPAYLARRVNTKTRDDTAGAVLRAIGVGALTSSGFVIIFGITGMAISLGALWVIKYMPWAGFMIGIALVLAGLFIMSGRKVTLRLPVLSGQSSAQSWTGDLLFGIGYGTASLSCTLPIFLAVTGTAITGGMLGSALTFLVYALGMGTVLMILAISAALARHGLETWVKIAGLYADRFSGGVMVLSGLYVTFYWGIILFLPQTSGAAGLLNYGDRIASPVRMWLGGQNGALAMLALLMLITLLLIWASWSRLIKKPKEL